MDCYSFKKLNTLITEAAAASAFRELLRTKPAEAAKAVNVQPPTPEEEQQIKLLYVDIDRFGASNPKREDAAIWSIGLLISSSASASTGENDEWTIGFFSIPAIRHSTTSAGEEWSLRFASIPMIRHKGGAK